MEAGVAICILFHHGVERLLSALLWSASVGFFDLLVLFSAVGN
jgi:hypothetical protein